MAYWPLFSGGETDDELRTEIRKLGREPLAECEYPREIEFVDEPSQPTTGKIRRLERREREDEH